MGRWTKTPGKRSEETYKFAPYGAEVGQTAPDMTEAAKHFVTRTSN